MQTCSLFMPPPPLAPARMQLWVYLVPYILKACAVALAAGFGTTLFVFPSLAADTTTKNTLAALKKVARMLSHHASALAQPAAAAAGGGKGGAAGSEAHMAVVIGPAAGKGAQDGQGKDGSGGGSAQGDLPGGEQDGAGSAAQQQELTGLELWGTIVAAQATNKVSFLEPGWWRWTALLPSWIGPRWARRAGRGVGGGVVSGPAQMGSGAGPRRVARNQPRNQAEPSERRRAATGGADGCPTTFRWRCPLQACAHEVGRAAEEPGAVSRQVGRRSIARPQQPAPNAALPAA